MLASPAVHPPKVATPWPSPTGVGYDLGYVQRRTRPLLSSRGLIAETPPRLITREGACFAGLPGHPRDLGAQPGRARWTGLDWQALGACDGCAKPTNRRSGIR